MTSQMLGKRDRDEFESCVPSLIDMAEAALQRAYELRCESIRLEPDLMKFAHLITPVMMNNELCRVSKRPAVE